MNVSRAGMLLALGCILGFATIARGELEFQIYGGLNETMPSRVELAHASLQDTRMVHWEGRSFEMPLYYGVRIVYWLGNKAIAIDFTHTKSYALIDFAKDPVYDELAFSHGNNLITANILHRVDIRDRTSYYTGKGSGITLAHAEVRLDKASLYPTNRYELAGSVRQTMIGRAFALGAHVHVFDESKISLTELLATLNGGGSISTSLNSPQWAFGLSLEF